jgi:hypothetical protein
MKPLAAGDYVVRPFITHKQQSYTYTYLGGGNPAQVSLDLAVVPPSGWAFDPTTEPKNSDLTYQRALYASVRNLFYTNASALITKFQPTGSQFYVVNIAQSAFGEGIQRGTFKLTSPSATTFVCDDGKGHLVTNDNTSHYIGNIFYETGIAIIQQDKTPTSSSLVTQNGIYQTTGSQVIVNFRATHTIYEHRISCTLVEGEGNYSTNPSMNGTGSNGVKVFDAYASGSLTPYMTTVGCYTDQGELVAIAKFPGPLKRAPETQQTFVIRFDV